MAMKAILAIGTVLLSAAAAASQAPADDSDRLVCRTNTEIGSRLRRARTCKTQAEWDALAREQRAGIDRAQIRQVNRTIDEKGRIH